MFRNACRAVAIIVVIFFCISVPFSAFAQAGQGDAADQVRHILDEVMAIQSNPQLAGDPHRPERKKRIQDILAKNFDMDRMAKDALGGYWPKLQVNQQAEYTAVFRDLFQDSYTRLVLDFLKQEQIRYSPAELKNGEALVKTVILRQDANIQVDYLLAPIKSGWRIHDVTIDGVSIVRKYEDAFSRVIRMKSYDELLEKLRLQQRAIQQNP
ncbi:MlaC/ttg2D family ABC transporter substrate-binding protein [Desulfatirhabdium butyrativorans]|uniref:MlaC/ttg2D family ABC transporter substrate-binding protein n=1 Tax=Desulfatirhabdium butyrativorans TaxID=340467 RepID=UPI0004128976|nr:ABC transporter substrate-binding protein [Desulfatirhabdium butyrativorans]